MAKKKSKMELMPPKNSVRNKAESAPKLGFRYKAI